MDRRQLLKRVDKAWEAFTESYTGLSDVQLMEAGVTSAWSVRDILAHVTTWEEEALKHLPLILKGGTPPRYSVRYGGLDAFNARMTEQKRSLSLSEVREQLAATHGRLVEFIQSAPEHQLIDDTRFRRRLRLDTYSHYPIHAEAIRQWRRRTAVAAGYRPCAVCLPDEYAQWKAAGRSEVGNEVGASDRTWACPASRSSRRRA